MTTAKKIAKAMSKVGVTEEFIVGKLKENIAMNEPMAGKKNDADKLRFDLVPWEALEPVVRVLMHGAKEYGDDNWRAVPDHERRYFAAAMRHLVEHAKCRPTDPQSGESHLAHAVCCLLFMIAREREH